MQWFSRRLAGQIVMISFSLLLGLHLLILLGSVPFTLFWGGRADANNIGGLTIFALGVTLFVIFVTASNLQYIPPIFPRLMRGIMWIICGYLLMNTLGNVWSPNIVEQYYFAPTTLILAICAGRVAWSH